MSDFNAKMHHIRLRLGLSAPDPAGGANSAPRPYCKGREGEGTGGKRRGREAGEGREERGRGRKKRKEKEGKGRGRGGEEEGDLAYTTFRTLRRHCFTQDLFTSIKCMQCHSFWHFKHRCAVQWVQLYQCNKSQCISYHTVTFCKALMLSRKGLALSKQQHCPLSMQAMLDFSRVVLAMVSEPSSELQRNSTTTVYSAMYLNPHCTLQTNNLAVLSYCNCYKQLTH